MCPRYSQAGLARGRRPRAMATVICSQRFRSSDDTPVDVVSLLARRTRAGGALIRRSMALYTEVNDLAATEFRATFGAFGLTQRRIAQLFGVGPRSVRRWQHGDRRIPRGVDIVLRLLAAGAVTVAQVEQAAVPVPVRTNGSARPVPPVPLLVAPAPAPAALARAEVTTFADSGLTTAEKIIALAPEACRWPCGDPRRPDFHFCSDPVAEGPYCEHHRTMAYMAPRTGGGHGARIRLVAQWGHQWPKASCPKGTYHVAAPVALSVPPAGAPNRRSVR